MNNNNNNNNKRGKANNNSVKKDDSVFNSILSMTIIFLVGGFVIYYLYKAYKDANNSLKKKDDRPIPKCPDYWESIEEGKCQNTHKISKCNLDPYPDNIANFNDAMFTNKVSGNYMKCKWSKECHAPWEGIDDLCS